MSTDNEKFNTIMPETTDKVLCVQVDKVFSEEGYKENFLPRVKMMIEKYGEIRVLLNYVEFKGWEHNAAKEDMVSSAALGSKLKKLALVNPPESEIFHRSMKSDILSGETKVFATEKLNEALEWIKS